jgi:ribosomal protein S18 acetylase RimI-like enzyme
VNFALKTRIKLLSSGRMLDPDPFLVAGENHEIGVVIGGWINHLAVKPSRQRRRTVSTLIDELERRLIMKGVKWGNAHVYEWNTKSLEFFNARWYRIHSDPDSDRQMSEVESN